MAKTAIEKAFREETRRRPDALGLAELLTAGATLGVATEREIAGRDSDAPPPENLADAFAETPTGAERLSASVALVDAAPVAPDDAIRLWREREIVTPEQYAALSEQARQHAFAIGGAQDEYLARKIADAIGRALEDGRTSQEFQDEVDDVFRGAGYAPDDPFHLRLVYRQNMSNAYRAGRDAQMAETIDERPYGMNLTAGDENTRPTHQCWDGLIAPLDHPIWAIVRKVHGEFNCRCEIVTLDAEDAKAEGGPWTEQRILRAYEQYVALGGAEPYTPPVVQAQQEATANV